MRAFRTLLAVLATLTTFLAAVAWQATRPDDGATRLAALGDEPRWLKGNLHTHSFWSDGDDFPEMIADWYRRHDYQFLALTDHNVLAEGNRWVTISDKMTKSGALKKYKARFGERWVQTRVADAGKDKGKEQVRLKPFDEYRSQLEEPGKYLLIPAEEITSSIAKKPVHINGVNLREVVKAVSGENVPEAITAVHRAVAGQAKKSGKQMLTFLNHPNFNWGVTAEEMAGVEELRYFEVYNGHPGVRNSGDAIHASCERIWDIVLSLRLGKRKLGVVYGLATDDAHNYHALAVGKSNAGRGWVMVRAPHLSAESVLAGIAAGDFYASTGVVLDELKQSPERITLKIRPEKGVTYRTEFVATMRDVSLEGKPRTDKDGKELPVTKEYSADIGKVVATTTDLEASYSITGKERYVRARITSSKKHPNPSEKGDVEMAWTQPVVVPEKGP